MTLYLSAHSVTLRAFSFGGGVQSHAVLALQAMKRITPYDVFVFANVGADSENPATLEYVERYTKPFCQRHNIPFVEVRKNYFGVPDTLLQAINRADRSIVIPARMSGNGAPGNRNCTQDFKIVQVDKYIKSTKAQWVTMGLGISLDEFHRARDTQWYDHEGKNNLGFNKRREYPLIDLRLKRFECIQISAEVGFPQPPKSSCYFCPFHRRNEWLDMKRDQPELFAKAVEVEHTINSKRTTLKRDRLYLHTDLIPLENVGNQPTLFDFESVGACDSGYCHT